MQCTNENSDKHLVTSVMLGPLFFLPRHLEALRKLCPSGIARVHRDKGHHRGLERNLHVLKQKALLASTQGVQHRFVLGAAHRQHGDGNAVELIKTSPGARLCKSLVVSSTSSMSMFACTHLVNLPHGFVIHLVAAVEDIALHTQGPGKVLGGFSLASTCSKH